MKIQRWRLEEARRTQRRADLGLTDKEDEPLDEAADPPIPGEQNLWVAVIVQAFADASWRKLNATQEYLRGEKGKGYRIVIHKKTGKSRRVYESHDHHGTPDAGVARANAISWLFGASKDFYDVCFLAGTTPEKVRDAARAAEAKDWPPIAAW